MTEEIGKDIIAAEMAKHGVAPKEQKKPTVTQATKRSVKEQAEIEDLETKITTLQRGASFSIKLNVQQLQKLEREAASNNTDWKTYFKQRIEADILDGLVGQTMAVTGPSFAKGKKVNGPSQWRN